MNVRLRKRFDWCSGMVYQGTFAANFYRAEISMTTQTQDHHEQNIAYDRMKYWMYDVMPNAIIMHRDDAALRQWQATGARILCLPEPPVDQIVGMMLHTKLTAIMEDRIQIHDIDIASTEGDDMTYQHAENESLGGLAEPGWWHDSRPIWSDDTPKRSANKVVTLGRVPEWTDHGLTWQPENEQDTSVVFANFKNITDADQPIR
jgi:hypothetical protein